MATTNADTATPYFDQFMLHYAKPPTTTATREAATSAAGVEELKQLLAMLQSQATPEGSAALIAQIYERGLQEGVPQINKSVAQAGARGRTSSYQALLEGNLKARLAGQAEVALQNRITAATEAATRLAQVTQSKEQLQKQVTGADSLLASMGIQIGGNIAKDALKGIFAKKLPLTTGATAAASSPTGIAAGSDAFAASSEWALAEASAEGATGMGTVAPSITGQGFMGVDPISTIGMYIASQEMIPAVARGTGEFIEGAPGFIGSIPDAASDFAAAAPGDIATGVAQAPGDAGSLATSGIKDLLSPITDPISEAAGTVICTELHRRQLLSDTLYRAYAEKLSGIDPHIMRGYRYWAVPIVQRIRKGGRFGKLLVALVKPVATARAKHILGTWNFIGACTVYIGEPICWLLGKFVSDKDYNVLYAEEATKHA